MLDLICGMCGQPIRVPDRAVGHRARCRGCGMEFVVLARAENGPLVVKPASSEPRWEVSSFLPQVALLSTPSSLPSSLAALVVPFLRRSGYAISVAVCMLRTT